MYTSGFRDDFQKSNDLKCEKAIYRRFIIRPLTLK